MIAFFSDYRALDGATSLMLASQTGCLDCVKLLISYEANPNVIAHDRVMAAHLALESNNEE